MKNRYWHPKCGRQWSFRTDTIVLYQMMDMPIVRVKSLDLNKNPFLNRDYFIKRKKEHEMKRKLAYQKSTAARSVLRGGTASNVRLLPDFLHQNIEEK